MSDEKQNLTCPFCNENDFDEVGLKAHLLGSVFYDGCEIFKAVNIAS